MRTRELGEMLLPIQLGVGSVQGTKGCPGPSTFKSAPPMLKTIIGLDLCIHRPYGA